MVTRPVPKSARIGTLGTVGTLLLAAVLLPMACSGGSPGAPRKEKAPTTADSPGCQGAEDCDPGEADSAARLMDCNSVTASSERNCLKVSAFRRFIQNK